MCGFCVLIFVGIHPAGNPTLPPMVHVPEYAPICDHWSGHILPPPCPARETRDVPSFINRRCLLIDRLRSDPSRSLIIHTDRFKTILYTGIHRVREEQPIENIRYIVRWWNSPYTTSAGHLTTSLPEIAIWHYSLAVPEWKVASSVSYHSVCLSVCIYSARKMLR